MARTSRLRRVLMIREVALEVLRTRGRKSTRYGFVGKHLEADLGELHMLHRFPAQDLPASHVVEKGSRTDSMSHSPGAARILDCGLDIWTPSRKVLNIEWTMDDHEVDLISFRRGVWEDFLLGSVLERRH